MPYVILAYNMLLIILFTVTATGYVIPFVRSKSAVDGWVALLFLFYILDNIILYMTEIIEEFARYYDAFSLSSNTIKTVVSIVIFLCMGNIVKYALRIEFRTADIMAYCAFIWALIFIPIFPTSRFTYWLYFTVSQVMFTYVAVRVWRGLPAVPEAGDLKKWRRRLIIAMILNIAIVVEDAIVIFLFDQISPMDTRINQRNVCEDIQSIYFAAIALSLLPARLFAPAPPPRAVPAAEAASPDLGLFGKEHGLTSRELEVLGLLMEGKTNQQISDQLFISLGTTKNHIHNIYGKCEVTRRSQMLRLVNESIYAVSKAEE